MKIEVFLNAQKLIPTRINESTVPSKLFGMQILVGIIPQFKIVYTAFEPFSDWEKIPKLECILAHFLNFISLGDFVGSKSPF